MYFDNYIRQTQKKFIAAPVAFMDEHSFLSRFQCLDFLSLQGITAASVSAGIHNMCNGANLCYTKQIFLDVRGFEGIDRLASGDDMLLMNKVKQQFPSASGYLYSPRAIVLTQPMPTWKAFIHQRIRWASKSAHYRDARITAVLGGVYLTNLFLLLSLVCALFQPVYLLYWLGLVIVKTLVELLLMQPTAAFFKQEKLLKWFPLMQPAHMMYIVTAGFLGMFGKYRWKGRTVK
jgi:cellulose synthase/poly-beta-1,6-N-acetylglucosamine synthase-like glycosyltransferase